MSVRIIVGDALAELRKLPDESVQMCCTSPPYYGLRDYGTAQWEGGAPGCDHLNDTRHQSQGATSARAGRSNVEDQRNENFRQACGKCGARRIDQQIGLEASPDEYVAALVAVFREVRRALRSDGVMFLNIGDSYASGGRATYRSGASDNKGQLVQNDLPRPPDAPGIKPKDLLGIPWMLAFALRADGWYLRQDIIWSKPNPMPESVTDRCTKAHEYLFLLSKSERYYYDGDAIAEPCETDPKENYPARAKVTGRGQQAFAEARGNDQDKSGGFPPRGRAAGNKSHKFVTEYESSNSEEHRTKAGLMKIANTAYDMRNKRSVWTVATTPYPGAHFATMPPDLVTPCVLAGAPPRGVVLDPFLGSGTTLMVADRLGRDGIGIELNPDYAKMAERRCREPGFAFDLATAPPSGIPEPSSNTDRIKES